MNTKRNMFGKMLKVFAAMAVLVMMMGVTSLAAGSKVVDFPKNAQGLYVYDGILDDSNTVMYHKIVVTKPGRLEVSGVSYDSLGNAWSMYVALCNSKMQVLESSASGSYVKGGERVVVYGVKKGTYYIRVKNEQFYRVAAAFKAVADKGGASKKKAVNMKAKKAITGVMDATEKVKKADWFKFKLKKSKVLNLAVTAEGNCAFRFYIYGPSYKKGLYMGYVQNTGVKFYSTNALTRAKAKVKAGTYYIKVVRDRKDGGVYSLKFS